MSLLTTTLVNTLLSDEIYINMTDGLMYMNCTTFIDDVYKTMCKYIYDSNYNNFIEISYHNTYEPILCQTCSPEENTEDIVSFCKLLDNINDVIKETTMHLYDCTSSHVVNYIKELTPEDDPLYDEYNYLTFILNTIIDYNYKLMFDKYCIATRYDRDRHDSSIQTLFNKLKSSVNAIKVLTPELYQTDYTKLITTYEYMMDTMGIRFHELFPRGNEYFTQTLLNTEGVDKVVGEVVGKLMDTNEIMFDCDTIDYEWVNIQKLQEYQTIANNPPNIDTVALLDKFNNITKFNFEQFRSAKCDSEVFDTIDELSQRVDGLSSSESDKQKQTTDTSKFVKKVSFNVWNIILTVFVGLLLIERVLDIILSQSWVKLLQFVKNPKQTLEDSVKIVQV